MKIDINIPDCEKNGWKVSTFEASKKNADFFNLRAMFQPDSRIIDPGTYKKLTHNGATIMSNTPAEIRDHLWFIEEAKQGTHILINGLGLGVVLTAILESQKIETITVIEISQDVIDLIAPHFPDKRVEIIHADAFEWKPPKGKIYSAVWHDIWNDICEDNLPEMTKLCKKYGRRCRWQGSWCKDLCLRLRMTNY